MIGGADHIVRAPGQLFGCAQLDALFTGLVAKWLHACIDSLTKGESTNLYKALRVSRGLEGPNGQPGFILRAWHPWEQLGPEFIVYKSKEVKEICDRDGVIEEIEDDLVLVYFYPDEITFVTGTSDAAQKWGQDMCQAMSHHVTAFGSGSRLPWLAPEPPMPLGAG